MYLGIDLGTSNSAIACFRDGGAAIFKTPEGTELMPSVIYRDRRGNQTVGVRAYDQATLAPENVVQGFKRLMGTATPQRFASAGQAITPEEASAEVLRAITGYALVEAGTNTITGAVITIPAAFNQMQSEATLAAAHAAGLDRVALLQEPVAAALAAMANARNRSGLFLV
jgi:molecular chaperone DnaK